MKAVLQLLFYIFFVQVLTAQKHDYNWVFGREYIPNHQYTYQSGGTRLDFNHSPVKVIDEQFDYACLDNCNTISDSSGQLSFLFNGVEFKDRFSRRIENGAAVNPWTNDTTGWRYNGFDNMKILPIPNNKYIVFCHDVNYSPPAGAFEGSNNLYYNVVDMNANNGLGKVLEKNILLRTGAFIEPVNCVKHANGRDWWVFTFDAHQNIAYTYLVKNGMIKAMPNQYDIGFLGNNLTSPGQTEALIAPNGEHLIFYNEAFGFAKISINRCNGDLQNEELMPFAQYHHISGGSFSSDSKYYFFTTKPIGQELFPTSFQINLDALNIDTLFILEETQTVTWDTIIDYSRMTITPDGRIFQRGSDVNYLDSINGHYSFHYFKYPKRAGIASDFHHAYDGFKFKKIPPTGIPQHPNYRLGPIDNSSCDTLGLDNHPFAHFRWDIEDTLSPYTVTFTDVSAYEPDTWTWDFDGLGASNDTDPVFTFPGPGVYDVCLITCNVNSCDTACQQVIIGDDFLNFTANFGFVIRPNRNIDFIDQSTTNPVTWQWDFGDGNTSTEQHPTHTYNQDGIYNTCLTACNAAGVCDNYCLSVPIATSNLNTPPNNSKIILYPNPANQLLHINLQNINDAQSIQIYNQVGQLVHQENLGQSSKASVSTLDFAEGMYLLQLLSAEGKIHTHKFIINHK